jgi:hypothetical protein
MSDALKPIVSGWNSKLNLAWTQKKADFQDDADEAMMFFNGPYDFLYGWRGAAARGSFTYSGNEDDLPAPAFRMTVNKVAELVQIFGPVLYHRNPIRKVNPRKAPMFPINLLGDPNDPNVQMQYEQLAQQVSQQTNTDAARATLLEAYLNYTPTALDLKTESRKAIDEAIIKGMGCLWTELYTPSGANGMKMVGSFYDTVDNLLIDPDMEEFNDAKWIARRCVHPYWQVEQEYGLKEGSLANKATLTSYGQQAQVANSPDGDYRKKQGQTNDLIVYWKIFSKMGGGGLLQGMLDSVKDSMQQFGKYVYLVVSDQVPYPLNLGPELSELVDLQEGDDPMQLMSQAAAMPEIQQRLQWPIPFWADDTWPVTPIVFHQIPRKIWPMSHIKPGMGELKFLNWAYSFLAGKVKTASKDFLAVAKSAGEELKDRIKTGQDYTIIEVEAINGSIDQVVKFLQHPTFNPEIYKVIEGVAENFDKRTGLTELAYGMSTASLRSAQEADVKKDQMSVRPDDMANKVEDAMTECARKEALAARWFLKGPDVQPVFGPIGAQWWDSLIVNSDPAEIIHQLEYRIEAGSTKKPNQQMDVNNMQSAMQSLFPFLSQYATTTGNVGPVNNLIAAWAKSLNMDPSGFLLPAPPPPPPMPAPAAGPPRGNAPAPAHPGAPPPPGHPAGPPAMTNGHVAQLR